ncbi:MAG: phosphonoacetaldehyde hydrolase [Planctomycetaceae bacterium]|nr:phosphonoacetaldehyde hydrolase [Planctomycetaceae bacterium]
MSPSSSGVLAVIFDISGTVLDYGSRAPVLAFVEMFARRGVAVTEDEARGPMGTHKIDHIWAMLSDPSIAQRWEAATGRAPDRAILDELYKEFGPLQVEMVKNHCDVIPGVPEVVQRLRARGIKIANTTGFDTWMMVDLIRLAGEGGYTPDLWVCPDQVGKGRPAPWMIHHAAKELGVYPLSSVVKVGDTVADLQEAHNAGVWAVSVIHSGNETGRSREQLQAMSAAERQARFDAARARLSVYGPHYIIDSSADLMPVIDDINARIARGERP